MRPVSASFCSTGLLARTSPEPRREPNRLACDLRSPTAVFPCNSIFLCAVSLRYPLTVVRRWRKNDPSKRIDPFRTTPGRECEKRNDHERNGSLGVFGCGADG